MLLSFLFFFQPSGEEDLNTPNEGCSGGFVKSHGKVSLKQPVNLGFVMLVEDNGSIPGFNGACQFHFGGCV